MSQPDFTIEYLDPKTLGENPFQYRRHPDSQKAAVQASLKEFGWVDGPLLNKRTGNLIDGHLRRDEAIAQGRETIPVKVVDLSEADERRLLRLFDPLTALAEEDSEALDRLIAEIGDPDLERLLGELETTSGLLPEADPDAIPEAVETRCKAGDLWRLGDHRLLVADCANPDNLGRLFDGASIDLCLTDPPYGIGKEFGEAYDDNRADYLDWCRDWFVLARDACKGGAIVFPGIANCGLWWQIDPPLWVCCWLKMNGQSRTALNGTNKWEPVLLWGVPHDRDIDVLDYGNEYGERIAASGEHPTPKPVRLISYLIDRFGGQSIFDPFLGSGTTLIAGAQSGKTVYGCEIEPRYCDVILARWEQATGRTAELIS